jgi:transposase InsO family protein
MAQVIRKTHPYYGLRKLHYTIGQQGFKIGRDALRKLLKQSGLLFKPNLARLYVKTTDSSHHFRLYPNLLRNMTVSHPEQVWVADTTFIKIQGLFYYLALVCDAYSRRIMGWDLQDKNTGDLTCKALLNAHGNRIHPQNHLIHHSDRGIQYCCGSYRMLLYKLSITVSTTESGDPKENAIMERAIRTLKYEYGLKKNFLSHQQAHENIEYAIDVYNHLRIHFSCQMNTPAKQHLLPLFV